MSMLYIEGYDDMRYAFVDPYTTKIPTLTSQLSLQSTTIEPATFLRLCHEQLEHW